MRNTYEFAGISVEITHNFEYFASMASGYESESTPKYRIEVTESDVSAEREMADSDGYTDGYLETLAIYRKVCECFIADGVLLFHSSAIAVDGRAYLFTAPSGTGKSTHTALWRELLGERAVMINDDKPLIAVKKDGAFVYGTPWNGKAHLGTNTSAPIAGICFLSRGEDNSIKKITSGEALPRLMTQTYRPKTVDGVQKMLALLIEMSNRVPLWSLKCNMDVEAAEVAYGSMSGNL